MALDQLRKLARRFGRSEDHTTEISATVEHQLHRTLRGERVLYPVVRVTSGDSLGAYASLAVSGEVIIGRDPSAGLRLKDPGVSRMHARVRWRADGRFEVQDLASTNGTQVDGTDIDWGCVQVGTRIEIVGVKIALELLEARQVDHLHWTRLRLRDAESAEA